MSNRRNSSKNQPATGSIRIIAGKHRGRKLPVLLAEGLRPTTDRVKETVFNWLMPYIVDSVCLDCFAGAGSLGFEASSRGAKKVVMIELNKQAAQQLNQNVQLLSTDNMTVHQGNALTYFDLPPQPFNVIFIDPPFRQGLVEQLISKISDGWLAPNALIYIETEAEYPLPHLPSHWQLQKEKVAGQVAYRLYKAVS